MDEREIIQKTLDDNPDLDPALRTLLCNKLSPEPLAEPASTPDKDPDDEIVVLCGYWPSIINGSRLVFCAECKTRCCIAPSTQQTLKGQRAKVRMVCLACFEKNPPKDAEDMLKLLKAARKTPPLNPFKVH